MVAGCCSSSPIARTQVALRPVAEVAFERTMSPGMTSVTRSSPPRYLTYGGGSVPGWRGIVCAVLVGLAGVATVATAGRHVWIQLQPEGSVPACGADLSFMLDLFPLYDVILKVFKAGGECAKIDWSFLGLSMPAWVLVLAVLLTAWGLAVNLRRQKSA